MLNSSPKLETMKHIPLTNMTTLQRPMAVSDNHSQTCGDIGWVMNKLTTSRRMDFIRRNLITLK